MPVTYLCVARHIDPYEQLTVFPWIYLWLFPSIQLQEDLPMDQYTSTVPQLHGRLDPVSYGSYSDAAIPFPRTSGAKFCACGELIVQMYTLKLPGFSSKMTRSWNVPWGCYVSMLFQCIVSSKLWVLSTLGNVPFCCATSFVGSDKIS